MKLLLIDGSNLIFRGYYATEKQNLVTPSGTSANAVHTLIGMINKMIIDHKPTHIFIGLDTGKSTFRHEKYPEYKGKRSETPERLREQFPLAKQLYDAMGIKHNATELYEADDLIATYAKLAKEKGFKVQIVSGDKDLLQLIDENVQVLTPKLGFSQEINYDMKEFEGRYGFLPPRFIEYKALVGDTSDNIIGVNKLGDITAKKLLKEYKTIEAIVTAAKEGEIKNKIGENIASSGEQIKDNLHLVTLIEDVDVKYNLDNLEFNDYQFETFVPFLKECGFTKYYNQFAENIELKEEEVTRFNMISEFNIKDHSSEENYIFTQTLMDNYFDTPCLGFGIFSDKGAFYLPFEKVNDEFIKFLKTPVKKITYNLKRLMGILKLQEVDGFIFDVYLGASLLNGENFKKPIDVLSISFGINSVKNYEEVYGAKSNPTMPTIDMVSRDIVSKAEAISKMYIKIVNELEVSKLNDVLYNIELPLTKVLAKMEIMGVNIDEKELDNLNEIYQNKIDKILIEIALITDININSPLQLSEYLFQENELPVKGIKKTKKNYSTDATNLKKLKKMLIIDDSMKKFVQLIDLILKYRIYTKLNSTYLLGIKKYIKKGKINPIYQQLLAETGRLSAIDPNIQNIPIRTEEGQIIRALFNCDEGYEIVAIDYSQVELRIIATMANEEKMLNDFANGLDIHTETAKKILGKDSITKAERSKAKAINFGIIYGMSQYGLAKQINVSNEEAYLFIEKHFETYPKIKIYMESLKTFAHKNEYVTTLFNRRRYLKNINCAGKMDREAAERMAINTPIQGTAADVIKLAMISVDEKITKENLPIKMAMQIHDELVFYMPKDSAKTLTQEIEKVMEMVVENKIQLKVESGFGKNWLEAK